ncbi:hypothetical protein [Ferrovum sp.]|uniref:hypothetical protein n=1 Tax=Ferrovum sp. TaxID=2609467 RepID=UPI0026305185|nr:hypothetical protein [Ferrovum sp.]
MKKKKHWFKVDGFVCRITPAVSLEELQKSCDDRWVEEVDELFHEAKMILSLPFSERQPFIDRTPKEQQAALKDEITKQWREKSCGQ